MISDFFIWCAGSDKNILSKCELSDRIKHIGLGTLVLIPAVMGTVSMSYALSTIYQLNPYPLAYTSGGVTWGLIVFAFDRFIVSTHKKSPKDTDEFNRISFYARLIFAIFVGIAISHPFVLLWFDRSIQERMIEDNNNKQIMIENDKQQYYKNLTIPLDSLKSEKKCYEILLTYEQSGKKIELPCGSSSGIPNISGNFPRTKEIKGLIEKKETEIKNESDRVSSEYDKYLKFIAKKQEDTEKYASTDYMKREYTLEELKKEEKEQGHNVIFITQFFIILVIMLVDLLPLIFKTFTPFSLYDKIRSDDITILEEQINTIKRKEILQEAYDKINSDYQETKIKASSITKGLKKGIQGIQELSKEVNYSNLIILGILFGICIWIFKLNVNLTPAGASVLAIVFGMMGNIFISIWNKMPFFSNKDNNNEII